MERSIPEGFRPLNQAQNHFVEAQGPLYGRLDGERFVLGFLCEKRHCNAMLACHGGMLATLADMLLLLATSVQSGQAHFLVTMSLAVDYLRPVKLGDWVEGRATVLRAGKGSIVTEGHLTVGAIPVLRAHATLKPTGRPLSELRSGGLFA